VNEYLSPPEALDGSMSREHEPFLEDRSRRLPLGWAMILAFAVGLGMSSVACAGAALAIFL
jgi:hypothetical protein